MHEEEEEKYIPPGQLWTLMDGIQDEIWGRGGRGGGLYRFLGLCRVSKVFVGVFRVFERRCEIRSGVDGGNSIIYFCMFDGFFCFLVVVQCWT